MRRNAERTIRTESIVSCDKCGRSFEEDDLEVQESFSWHYIGGYTSIWGDGAEFTIDICQQCFREAFNDYLQWVYDDGA